MHVTAYETDATKRLLDISLAPREHELTVTWKMISIIYLLCKLNSLPSTVPLIFNLTYLSYVVCCNYTHLLLLLECSITITNYK